MKLAHCILVSATIVGIAACSTMQKTYTKASSDLATLNAWASSPQGTAQIRATEKAASNLLATVAPLVGSSKTADYLDAAATISNAYAGMTVPANVVNDTLAAVPSLVPVVSPLISNGANTAKTAALINTLAATVRSLAPAPSPTPAPVGELIQQAQPSASAAKWDYSAYPNPNVDPTNAQRNRQLNLTLH